METNLVKLFQETVPEKFDFLVKEYGFSLEFDICGHFVARSPYCQIMLVFEKKHFECWLERLDMEAYPHDAIEVVVVATCLGYHHNKELRFPSDTEVLTDEIELNVKLLREYCSDFLRGDFGSWTRVVDCLEERGKLIELTRDGIAQEAELSAERELAQLAWSKKDFLEVITHYENIQSFLTASEKKKLEYAKKQKKDKPD